MCEIWLKSVHRGLLYDYVKYKDFVTFCTFPFLSFPFFLVVAYSKNDWTDFNAWWLVWRGFAQGSAFWGSRQWPIMFKGRNSQKNWHFWAVNRHFKPNLLNLPMAISSKLHIRSTRNLKSSFWSPGRLRGGPKLRNTNSRWRTAAILDFP